MTRTRAPGHSPRIPGAARRAAFPRVVAPPVKKLVRRSWTVWVEGEPREEVRLLTERDAAAFDEYMRRKDVPGARQFAMQHGTRQAPDASGAAREST